MDEYLVITRLGYSQMDLMSRNIYVPGIPWRYGQALYALEEGYEVMPWTIRGLLRDGYIMRDCANRQADEILVGSNLGRSDTWI